MIYDLLAEAERLEASAAALYQQSQSYSKLAWPAGVTACDELLAASEKLHAEAKNLRAEVHRIWAAS